MEKTSLYKIGVTKGKIENRIKKLQTGNPLVIKIEKFYNSDIYQKIESILHRRFKHKKYVEDDFDYIKGEWFILDFYDVKNFTDTCKIIEENIKFLENNKI